MTASTTGAGSTGAGNGGGHSGTGGGAPQAGSGSCTTRGAPDGAEVSAFAALTVLAVGGARLARSQRRARRGAQG
jgi:hypothetical protein